MVSAPDVSTVMSLPPMPRMALPIGWISFLSAVVAFSISSGLVTFTCTELPTMPRPVKPILASRSDLRVSSRSVLSQSFSSSLVSMASSRCAPPRRSRPSGSCLCGSQPGQLSTVSLEKKFGIVKSTPARQVRTMAMIFQRSKCSICRPISFAVSPMGAQRRLTSSLLSARPCCAHPSASTSGREHAWCRTDRPRPRRRCRRPSSPCR